MALTYEPIATTTLGANGNITFSSIPATYTDLRIVLVSTGATVGAIAYMRFNGDTATNYSFTSLYGDGTSAASLTAGGSSISQLDSYYSISTNKPNLFTIDIFSYAGSTNKTSLITFSNDLNGLGSIETSVNLWRSTAAINTILLAVNGGSFTTGTTATLYGIKAA
jgi:hypothetical protein